MALKKKSSGKAKKARIQRKFELPDLVAGKFIIADSSLNKALDGSDEFSDFPRVWESKEDAKAYKQSLLVSIDGEPPSQVIENSQVVPIKKLYANHYYIHDSGAVTVALEFHDRAVSLKELIKSEREKLLTQGKTITTGIKNTIRNYKLELAESKKRLKAHDFQLAAFDKKMKAYV